VGESRTLFAGDDRGYLWQNGTIYDVNALAIASPVDVINSCNAITEFGRVIAYSDSFKSDSVCLVLDPMPNIDGDVDHTCSVNVDDLLIVINEWGNDESVADINKDRMVDHLDLMIVIENWTY
jgi:hypothetical protein